MATAEDVDARRQRERQRRQHNLLRLAAWCGFLGAALVQGGLLITVYRLLIVDMTPSLSSLLLPLCSASLGLVLIAGARRTQHLAVLPRVVMPTAALRLVGTAPASANPPRERPAA